MKSGSTALRHAAAITAVFLTAVTLVAGGATMASATSKDAARASTAAASSARVFNKVTLNETSIDGPGFSSVVGSFEGVSFNRTVIAWAGTDAAHHLNVMDSKNGLSYSHKVTLGETSPYRPDVTQLAEPAGGEVILAWTGSDANHSLNVLYNVYGSRAKLTLSNERSIAAPAILWMKQNDLVLLAWTGTDANHSLNVLPIHFGGGTLRPATKTILSQFSSNAGPRLALLNNAIVLAWSTRANHLNFASSTNGATFTSALGAGLADTSAFAPDPLYYQTEAGPEYWMAWTGTDSAHHLNLRWTTHYPNWPDGTTKTVLADTAFGGPAVSVNPGPLLAWTGTDASHHLNVANFEYS